MFPDWLTISFGKIDQSTVWAALARRLEKLRAAYPRSFTRRTFGNLSVCLPGQHWQSMTEEDGMTLADDVLHFCASAHVSRFDLAHDWSLETTDADKIWAAVGLCGQQIDRLLGHAGTTWYVGSRESDRFARLYDKAAEIKARSGIDIRFPVLRFEAELKGRVAAEYFAHWRRKPDMVQSDLASRYNLHEFMTGSSTEVIRALGLAPPDPFAFVKRFAECISYARALDPARFDKIIPRPRCVTALPRDTA